MLIITMLLKHKVGILLVAFVSIPILVISTLLFAYTDKTTAWERQHKLFGVTQFMNLGIESSYEDILKRKNLLSTAKQTQIQALNNELKALSEKAAASNPGVRVGYYSLKLDAYVTDSMTDNTSERVGVPLSADSNGRTVMETGAPLAWEETTPSGGTVMHVVQPLIRGQQIVGCILASEPMEDLKQSMFMMKTKILLGLFSWFLLGFGIFHYINKAKNNEEAT